MRLKFLSKIFNSIGLKIEKQVQNTIPVPSLWRYFLQKVIGTIPSLSVLALTILILVGLIPMLIEHKDHLPSSFLLWAAITILAVIFSLLMKGIEISQRALEVEEQKKEAQHIRDIQWKEIEKAQKRDTIESGIRIANACTELLKSKEFEDASTDRARLMLIQIFRDEEVVDEFLKFADLSKFREEKLGQAKDDYVVLSTQDDPITARDVRHIEAAIGIRFGKFLLALKRWTKTYPKGLNDENIQSVEFARDEIITELEKSFKGTNLSQNYKDHFRHIFFGNLKGIK